MRVRRCGVHHFFAYQGFLYRPSTNGRRSRRRTVDNRRRRAASMERETASDNATINLMASRRWLTLEQLLQVLPLKKSYIYYLAHTTDSGNAHRPAIAVRLRPHRRVAGRKDSGRCFRLTWRWTHRSLRPPHKATAQVRYSQFLKQLEDHELLFSELRPLRLSEFAEEYLRHVKSHKSAS